LGNRLAPNALIVFNEYFNPSCYHQIGSLEMERARTKRTSLSSKPSAVTV
jgi:hypothetical protein